MQIVRYIKTAFRYAAMPGIVPRLRRFDLRFPFIAYLIAQIYAAVRLLPPAHAYLNPANAGTYSTGHVVMAAYDRLRESRAYDQMIVFGIISLALALLLGQFGLLILMLGIDTAQAASGTAVTSLFETPRPEKDIALMMLDLVFGVPGIFGSEHAPSGPGDINPFHQGLHELFKFYSYAVLALGGVILFYYLVAVVLETAQTGTPFGQRFDNIYAPLRLVIAVGLLIPIHYGLNAGQHLTLNLAKWGSGMATNGWLTFNQTLSSSSKTAAKESLNMLGASNSELLAKPRVRNVGSFVEFFYLANMCAYHYERYGPPPKSGGRPRYKILTDDRIFSGSGYYKHVQPYLVRNQAGMVSSSGKSGKKFKPEATYKKLEPGVDLQQALEFYNYGNITIRFGKKDYGEYPGYKGGVKPLCGEVTISVNNIHQDGAWYVYQSYLQLIKLMWQSPDVRKFAIRYYLVHNVHKRPGTGHPACGSGLQPTVGPGGAGGFDWGAACDEEPGPGYAQEIINERQALINSLIEAARKNYIQNGAFDVNEAMKERGWGGAAIWFNDIAAANGGLFSAVYSLPSVTDYPSIMQKVADQRRKTTNASERDIELFKPNIGDDAGDFDPGRGEDDNLAEAGYSIMQYFEGGSVNTRSEATTGNPFHDLVNMLLGTQGLFSIRENREVHPLAQMTALGRSMLDTSIRNFALGAAAAAVPSKKQNRQETLQGISTSMVGMAFMGLTLGFILQYILPFLPFIYFFFAVSNWVKELFEAMVGVPLWAVAHLQLEGKGLPGSAAGDGYFLLFGIFLRPILILFGLIAAIAVFSAQAIILHDIFDLVVANLTGHGGESYGKSNNFVIQSMEFTRSSLDEFFYTVVYVIILYLMATASFKLIDAIPESILRWAGSDAKPFSDEQDDPTNSLVRNVAIGSRMALQQPVTEATVQFGQGAGGAVSSMTGGLTSAFKAGPGTAITSVTRGFGR